MIQNCSSTSFVLIFIMVTKVWTKIWLPSLMFVTAILKNQHFEWWKVSTPNVILSSSCPVAWEATIDIHLNNVQSETDPRQEMTRRSNSPPADEFICSFKVKAQQNNTICVRHLVHEYQWNSITCSPSTTVALTNENVTENRFETLHFNASIKLRND